MSKFGWVSRAVKHKGALHRDLHIPQGQKIPASRIEAAAHGSGKTAQRARFAMAARKFKH